MKRFSATIILTCSAVLICLLLAACTGSGSSKSESGSIGTVISESTERSTPASGTAEANTEGRVSLELTLANFNIKHGAEGLENVAQAIREIAPDIIGLEEVDIGAERSGGADEAAELARLAGFSYYVFARAIPLGAGEYGTAILSRYPIESFEVTPLESGNGEDRSVGHAVINVQGLKLDVFVTHLSFEDRGVRIEQMKTIAGMLKKCKYYALMGDLNSFDLNDIAYLEGEYFVNRPDRRYGTFRNLNFSPDNIVVSRGFTELSSGISDRIASDHRLLYAVFRFEEE